MSSKEFNLTVNGWGPCFHSEKEGRVVQEWIDHLVPPRVIQYDGHGGQIEDFAWLINIEYNGTVEFIADQWVAVLATGSLWKTDDEGRITDNERRWKYSIYLQSDSFLAGIAGVFAWLKWKQAEVNANMHDDNYSPKP